MKTRVLCLLGLLTLTGCDSALMRDPPPPPPGPQVTGDALRTTLAGNSIVTTDKLAPPLTVFFSDDGEMRGLRSNQYRDHGTWKVEQDTVCGAWNNWWGTLNACWEVFAEGNRLTLRRVEDGREAQATLAAGNVRDL